MIQKKFNKSFDDALSQAYVFHTNFLANKADFIAFSSAFADPYGANFLTLINDADSMPTFEDDQSEQVIFTLQVEETMEKARNHYKKLLFSIESIWPDTEVPKRAFRSHLYDGSRQVPQKMMNLLQNAFEKANSTTYNAALIAGGFDAADITMIDDLEKELKERYTAQQDFITLTFERTESRTETFNKVWDEMVKISNASKLIFKDSPAKIETFMLYPEGPGPGYLTAPQNVTFNAETLTLSWDSVDNATSYQVRYSTDNVTFEEIYNSDGLSVYFEPLTEGMIYFIVRARNAGGFGPEAAIELDYVPVLQPSSGISLTVTNATTHTIALNWSPVNFATGYRLYRSTVALGADEGAYFLVGEYSGTTYSGAQTAGMRHYFHVVSVNTTQTSVPSLPVFVDL